MSHYLDPAVSHARRAERTQSTVARPVPEEFLEAMVQESLKLPARVWRAAFDGVLASDLSGERHRIQSPTLIIWGDQDAIIPRRDQETLAAAIKGSQLVVYAGTGHTPHWEEPARLAADLVAFAERLVS